MTPLAVALGVFASTGTALAAPDWQESAETLGDARCLLVMVALSHAKNPAAARGGQVGVVFFSGRISARAPGYNYAQLRSIAAHMTAKQVQSELQRCGPVLGGTLTQVRSALTPPRPAPAPAPPANPGFGPGAGPAPDVAPGFGAPPDAGAPLGAKPQ
jgi:hypothetical protein